MTDTLETIRQNWKDYKNIIPSLSPKYEELWTDLEKKYKINTNDIFYETLKKFINNGIIINEKINFDGITIIRENDKTLVFKDSTGSERKEIHMLCDNIGLDHESKGYNNDRCLYVYMPEKWSWDFTNVKSSRSYNSYKKHLKECEECGSDSSETDLYMSVYIGGIYCEDCLGTMSDGEGGTFSDHKFEPV